MTIKERIRLFADTHCSSRAEVERNIGMSKGTLGNDSKMNADAVVKLFECYPILSAEWLMRGEGEMIKSSHPSNVNNFDLSDHHNNYANGANSTAQSSNENKELIELLKQQNEAQTAQIATLTKLVETLANK